jgi:putative ABC transport system ATP-binding protein
MEQQQAIIKTENLARVYRWEGADIEVIRPLSIEIYRGEFTVIMGNSGSGKSTLLYLLSGLDRATDGKIWINQLPVHHQSEKNLAKMRRRTVGFVFQDHHLIPQLSIIDNLLIAAYLVNTDTKSILPYLHSLLRDLDIADKADRLPAQLSGGELQRASIARALVNHPQVIMADEPTGNLHSQASEKVLDALELVNRKGQSILMVTHDLRSALRGDRILFLKDGSICSTWMVNKQNDRTEEEAALFSWLKKQGW